MGKDSWEEISWFSFIKWILCTTPKHAYKTELKDELDVLAFRQTFILVTNSNIMCLGTLIVSCPVNVLFFYFLFTSVALMVEISNSWVYGLPTEKTFMLFLVGSTLIFGPSTLEKGTTKLPMSVD